MDVHNENTVQQIRVENQFIKRAGYIGNNDRGCAVCYIEDFRLNNNLLGTGETV